MPASNGKRTASTPVRPFEAGTGLSARHLNQLVAAVNSPPGALAERVPRLVKTVKDASGNYPAEEDEPNVYPFRFINIEITPADIPLSASASASYTVADLHGDATKPDGFFLDAPGFSTEARAPYRVEGTILIVHFTNGVFWSADNGGGGCTPTTYITALQNTGTAIQYKSFNTETCEESDWITLMSGESCTESEY